MPKKWFYFCFIANLRKKRRYQREHPPYVVRPEFLINFLILFKCVCILLKDTSPQK